MPAGDLLAADWQVEIDGLLTGAGTDYMIEPKGIAGLGVPAAKTQDVDRQHAAGTYMGRDYTGSRVVTIPYVISVETAAAAGVLFLDLAEAWQTSETDIELHLQLPGFGHISLTGRPRGLVDDLSIFHTGTVRALATFFAGDPTITFVAP